MKTILKYLFIVVLTTASLLATLPEKRIVNGSVVSSSSSRWSWIASLQVDREHECGATLLSKEWAITAAHCLLDNHGIKFHLSSLTIATGSYNLDSDMMQEYAIEKFILHPQYDFLKSDDSDMALVKLTTPVEQDLFPQISKYLSLSAGRKTWVAGWGVLRSSSSQISSELNELSLPIVDYSICNSFLGYDGLLTTNMLCAGYMLGGKDSCGGDSGGPLITYEGGQQILIGIVSFGIGCAEMGHPGVYVNVENYYDWIEYYIDATSETPKEETAPPDIVTIPDRGDVTKLYIATFNRAPDAEGLDYWINSSFGLEQIAMSFFDQVETQTLYPNPEDADSFIRAVYQNLFNRDTDRAGLTYWSIALSSGNVSKSLFILAVINGALGDDNTTLENKKRVGEEFANRGLSSATDAKLVMSSVDASQESVDQALLMIDELSLTLLQ